MAVPTFINFLQGTLNKAFSTSDSTVEIAIDKKFQKNDGTFYSLTDDKTSTLISALELTIKHKNNTKIELMRVSGVVSGGTTTDGRPIDVLTIETNGGTGLRGLANSYDGTDGTANVISNNKIAQFPKNSQCIIAVNTGVLQRALDTFTAGTTTNTANAGEDIAVKDPVSLDSSGSVFKYNSSSKPNLVGIANETISSGNNVTYTTFGGLSTGHSGLTPGSNEFAENVVVAPGASTAAIASPPAPGNVDNGAHDYKISFSTGSTETEGGTASGSVTITDKSVNGQIELTAIPTSVDGRITARKIYRRFNASGTYKLVATVADNTTTIFTDNVANSSLGADILTTSTITNNILESETATTKLVGVAETANNIRIVKSSVAPTTFADDEFDVHDDVDATKKTIWTLGGATTGKTITLKSDHTDDRTWTFPDETGTGATQSFANNVGTGASLISIVSSEALTKGDAVYIDTPPTTRFAQNSAVNNTNVGSSVTNEKIAVPFVGSGVSASTLTANFKKVGTPTDNLVTRIETDSGGLPSGTLADANATGNTGGGGLTTSYVDTTVTFAGSFTLAANTKFWIVFERSAALDVSNFYRVGAEERYSTSFQAHQFVSSTWTARTNISTYFGSFTGAESELLTKTDSLISNSAGRNRFFGFVNTTAAAFASTKVDALGVSDTQSGLTVGDWFFLTSTPGGIGTSPTANGVEKAVGKAVSSTAIQIIKTPTQVVNAEAAGDFTTTSATPVLVTGWIAGNGFTDHNGEFDVAAADTFTAKGSRVRKFTVTGTIENSANGGKTYVSIKVGSTFVTGTFMLVGADLTTATPFSLSWTAVITDGTDVAVFLARAVGGTARINGSAVLEERRRFTVVEYD